MEETLSAVYKYCTSNGLSETGLRRTVLGSRILQLYAQDDLEWEIYLNYPLLTAVCENEKVTDGVVQYLFECFSHVGDETFNLNVDDVPTPLHIICRNPSVTLKIVNLLLQRDPNSHNVPRSSGNLPIHSLCSNSDLDETIAREIFQRLIDLNPGCVKHQSRNGSLPIHVAAGSGLAIELCQLMLDAYPDSVKVGDLLGKLPLHIACRFGWVTIAKRLLQIDPGSLCKEDAFGFTPLNHAIEGVFEQRWIHGLHDEQDGMIKYLLQLPDIALETNFVDSIDPLLMAFRHAIGHRGVSSGTAYVSVMKQVYDVFPNSLRLHRATFQDELDIPNCPATVSDFINNQLRYIDIASNQDELSTPDQALRRLPIHHAVFNQAPLGSVKLLLQSFPLASRVIDSYGALPLHLACQSYDDCAVVCYLAIQEQDTLKHQDHKGELPIHYACRWGKYSTIHFLLNNNGANAAARNAEKKLPIELILETHNVADRESAVYLSSIFCLLKANPSPIVANHQ